MSNEELPENQHYEKESVIFNEVLANYFKGEVPNEGARKHAFKLLFDTSLFNRVSEDEDEWNSYNMNGY